MMLFGTGVAFFFEEFDTDVYSGRLGFLDAWNYAFLAAGDITDVGALLALGEALTLRSPVILSPRNDVAP